MTKVMCKIDEKKHSIFFDCMNHAGFKDVCIMCSTLCKVLLEAVNKISAGNVRIDDGHVRIEVEYADDATMEIFSSVMEVFKDVATEFPDYCKLY